MGLEWFSRRELVSGLGDIKISWGGLLRLYVETNWWLFKDTSVDLDEFIDCKILKNWKLKHTTQKQGTRLIKYIYVNETHLLLEKISTVLTWFFFTPSPCITSVHL